MNYLRQLLQQLWRPAQASARPAAYAASLVACAVVLTVSPAFDNRLARNPAAPPAGAHALSRVEAPPLDGVAVGRRLIEAHQCGACHRIEGVSGAQGTQGPALVQWRQRSYIAGRVPNTPGLLAAWLVDPSGLVPGTPMPDLGVTPRDAQLMAAYLLRLE